MASPYLSIDSSPTGTAGTEAGEHSSFDIEVYHYPNPLPGAWDPVFHRLRADNRVRIGAPVIAVLDESWHSIYEEGYLGAGGEETPWGTGTFLEHLLGLRNAIEMTYLRTNIMVMPAVLHVKAAPPTNYWRRIIPPSQEEWVDDTGFGPLDRIYYQRVQRNPGADEFHHALGVLKRKYALDKFLGVLVAIDGTDSMRGADLGAAIDAAVNMGDEPGITLVPGDYGTYGAAEILYSGTSERWVKWLHTMVHSFRRFLVDPNDRIPQ
jgi:hypothetical protein